MKILKTINLVLVILIIGISIPENATAQLRKTPVVKRTTVKRGVVRKRPVRVRRAAHIRYRHLPRWGKSVRRIGIGYRAITYRGIGYRFHKGVWYRPKGNRFIVARAPFGVRVRTLPISYRQLVIGSRPYFYYYGTFYVKVEGTSEYEVVEPPIGAEVDALPDGYTIVKVNGQEYYTLEDTYYEAHIDDNDNEYYIVIDDPTK